MWLIFKILTTQVILNTTCQFCQQYETGHEHTIVSGSLNKIFWWPFLQFATRMNI